MYHVKRDKRSVQSSDWIFNALRALMAEKRYEQITITEVVARAGLGRATFYRNFDTIDDVLRLRCDQKFAELTALLLENYKKTALDAKIPAPHRLFLRFWYVESEILELLVQARRHDIILKAFEAMSYTLAQQIGRIPFGEPYLGYLFSASNGAVLGLLFKWISQEKNIPPDELSDFMDSMTALMAERFREFHRQGQKEISSSDSPAAARSSSPSGSEE